MAMTNLKEKAKAFFVKIKTIKNIEIIIAIIIIAIIILAYSYISSSKSETSDGTEEITGTETSLTDQLENELSTVLSQINGAGKVEVMITYSGTTEKVIANTKSTHINSSTSSGSVVTSTSTITETPIVINNDGISKLYVVKEIMPEITGVIIVSEGAKDARIRLELMRAAQTILDINANSIEIFAMK